MWETARKIVLVLGIVWLLVLVRLDLIVPAFAGAGICMFASFVLSALHDRAIESEARNGSEE